MSASRASSGSRRASISVAMVATVGEAKMTCRGRSTEKTARDRAITLVASSEWPPTWKKLSSTPATAPGMTSRQISSRVVSVSVVGLLFDGLAFVLMIPAAMLAVSGRMVSPLWLTGCYFLQTVGELSLSPVGLSAMSKLAPDRAAGLMMGIWFLSISIGNWLVGKLPALYSAMPLPSLFGAVAAFSIAAAVLLALLIKPTVRLMGGVK